MTSEARGPLDEKRRSSWISDLLAIRRSRLGFLRQLSTRGALASFSLGRMRMFLVNCREGAHHVLVEAHGKYRKGIGLRHAERLLGRGLLTSEGELWRAERRLIQPFFARHRSESYLPAIISEVESMLERWSTAARLGNEIDLEAEMHALALRMLARALLGPVVDREVSTIGPALAVALAHAMARMQAIFRFTAWLPTRANRSAAKAVDTLDGVVDRVLASPATEGLVAELRTQLATNDPQLLRDEIITLLVAGHETTACVLAWSLYLLSQHRTEQALTAREAGTVLGTDDLGCLDGDKVGQLRYCRAVILEAMRLYPPVWIIPREAVESDKILGTSIRPGDGILISPYTLHRNPTWWPDPEQFQPERFLDTDNPMGNNRAYIPFGAGPRKCIGYHFGLFEAITTLALVMRRFDVCTLGNSEPGVTASMTLKFTRPIKIAVTPRISKNTDQ